MTTRPDDSALFDRAGWWDPGCRAFASLRRVSAFRLALLSRWLGDDWQRRLVVDLGCGGGLLAAPIADRGARVLGVDLATAALREAHEQARRGAAPFQPVCGSLEQPPIGDGVADIALLADVLEHVERPELAVERAARLLRPGGHLFVNTIDRTVRSRLFAIWLGEGLGLIPRGTHEWSRFIRPAELDEMAGTAGLRRVRRTGEAPRLGATIRRWAVDLRESRSTAVGYAALYVKDEAS